MIKSTNLVMNTDREPPSGSRRVREINASTPTASEAEVLGEVLKAIRRVRHGNVSLSVQDGRVIQLDVTEKRRF